MHQARLSGLDPWLSSGTPGVEEEKGCGHAAEKGPSATARCGSQLDLAETPFEDDIFELDCDEDDVVSNFRISEEDDDEDILVLPATAVQPVAPTASPGESSTLALPPPTLVMLDVCKCIASRLEVPWPITVTETTKSRYEGKTFPLVRSAAKQPLSVFPELLEEQRCYWKNQLYSDRSALLGASSLY